MTTLLKTDRVGCAGVLAIGAAMMLAGCATLDGLIASLPRWPVATPAGTNTPPPVVVTPAPDKPATVNVDGLLVMPPERYTEAYMSANGESEECGIERRERIICRPYFCRPGWIISSLASGHVRRGDAGIDADDWTADGRAYHVAGGWTSEPHDPCADPLDVTGNRGLPKWIKIEIRAAK